jgi:cullin 1
MSTNLLQFDFCRWNYIEAGVEKILAGLRGEMDMRTFYGLYTAIHNFCTVQKTVATTSFSLYTNRGGAHLLGEDLYTHLGNHLMIHVQGIRARSEEYVDEALLTFYIEEWDRYETAAKYNNHLFRYLNRHWVKREMDEGKKNIYDIYTLHLVLWKEDMFTGTHERIMQSALELIKKQRNGETIELSLIKSVVDMFVALGLDESDSLKSTLDVYKEYFEKPFLKATGQYYDNESKRLLTENSVVEYMKKAEARLDQEKDRGPLYLENETMNELMRTCEYSLIGKHSGVLRGKFHILLDHDQQEDLGRMFKLLARVPEGLDPLVKSFETYVLKAGREAVGAEMLAPARKYPEGYLDVLQKTITQYSNLVHKAFDDSPKFTDALEKACKEFVNDNEACERGSSKSATSLAQYASAVLPKTNHKSEVENTLAQIMVVFKYIDDKDTFQDLYFQMLVRRLVSSESTSTDAETGLINKLKEACGPNYTYASQRMLRSQWIRKADT